jgi:RNA polymerase sigma factor (sigma-70 family)
MDDGAQPPRFTLSSVEAFSSLYEAASPDLLLWFARRVLQPDVALDLTAETFARAFKSRDRFRGGSREEALGWLYVIARRQLADYFRKGRADRRVVDALGIVMPELSQDEFERVEELADLERRREEISRELSRLSVDQREALELRIVNELPYADVAARLGVSEVTARSRVSRGLRALAVALRPETRPEESTP